jgi:hypothetical protein
MGQETVVGGPEGHGLHPYRDGKSGDGLFGLFDAEQGLNGHGQATVVLLKKKLMSSSILLSELGGRAVSGLALAVKKAWPVGL